MSQFVIFGGTNPILLLFFFLFLMGRQKAQLGSVVSTRIRMKFGRIVLHIDWRSRIFDMTSNFQDGGSDVCPPLAAAYAVASVGCPLARQARVTLLARCMRYCSWSIVHSSLLVLRDEGTIKRKKSGPPSMRSANKKAGRVLYSRPDPENCSCAGNL